MTTLLELRNRQPARVLRFVKEPRPIDAFGRRLAIAIARQAATRLEGFVGCQEMLAITAGHAARLRGRVERPRGEGFRRHQKKDPLGAGLIEFSSDYLGVIRDIAYFIVSSLFILPFGIPPPMKSIAWTIAK